MNSRSECDVRIRSRNGLSDRHADRHKFMCLDFFKIIVIALSGLGIFKDLKSMIWVQVL